MSNENYRLKKMASLIKDKNNVLDIGCSEKLNLYLKNNQVIGFDRKVPSRFPDNYSKFITGNVEDMYGLLETNYFDGIIAGEIIEHLKDPIDFLSQCYNLLKTDGKIVLSTPNPNSPIERFLTLNLSSKYFYTSDHIMLYPQRWLIRIMEVSGFIKVKLYSGGIISPLGKLIPFPRAFCYQTIAVGYKLSK
jgi:2-polyprenyl-3-methyl-5-hydroxy-6-metoxy-1,4-benzoquinol methylase